MNGWMDGVVAKGVTYGYMTIRPTQFQPMQFQPLTISTYAFSTVRNFDLH